MKFVIFAAFLVFLTGLSKMHSGTYVGPPSDHFDGTLFYNPQPFPERHFFSFLWMRLTKDWAEWPEHVETIEGPKPPSRIVRGIRYSVINHASVLIQTPELNILTDPIWSERCSPFTWIGPKRVVNPGLRFEDLPPIDVVLISHNHYDSMDIPTLERLQDRFNPIFFTGLGNKDFLNYMGIQNVQELDWWDVVELKGSVLHFVPAVHFSGRGFFDRNHTLWGGFVVDSKAGRIYFSGDSGYSDLFKRIGAHFTDFTLAFLPIGAYEPREFMGPVHMNPSEAVKVHQEIHARKSVGVHFGTFHLTAEDIDAPKRDLREALDRAQIAHDKFVVPEFGAGYCEGC
ncbi:MAG: MBL fold metallo-hydrolase [Deltaproteobacteria bacterium]|nr:MBL fold metallo-hydrolase [Deltaproteobacteria bacterium]